MICNLFFFNYGKVAKKAHDTAVILQRVSTNVIPFSGVNYIYYIISFKEMLNALFFFYFSRTNTQAIRELVYKSANI